MRFYLKFTFSRIFQNPESQQKQQEQAEQRTQAINSMLSQLLDQQARARLNTLKISKPEKAEIVRNANETPDGLLQQELHFRWK